VSAARSPAGDDVEAPTEEEGRRRRTRNLFEWLLILGGAFLVALLVKTFLIQAFYIPSDSMFPALRKDDRVLVNKLSYDVHDVNRGDLVVFERPPNERAGGIKDLIKRVVAREGETVEERDGRVYVDGRQLEEPYLDDGVRTMNLVRQEVPPDHVFVLGDNRSDSSDSRVFGPVAEDDIVGRAFIRVWPLFDISLL
jgi:signal peptidase I